ncbi:MAG: 50S ribosomal protein P1 [Candidatus Woesearchaeota archaeon]|nr:MAG: 50S ribosomal protein P1 [Candidatus Woesearchaeota archaeon]
MEYIYAAMLLHKAGKSIDEAGMKSVLTAAGIKADEGRIKAVIAALEGVDIEEAIKNAQSMPVAAAPAAGGDASAAKAEEPKEEKKEDEGAAAAGLGALFG